jgi:Flp pilus assembly protein TadD
MWFLSNSNSNGIQVSNKPLILSRNRTNAHSNLGAALGKQGELEEAVAEFQTVIRIEPDNAFAHYNLGNVLAIQGERAEAIAEFRRARDHAPSGSDLAQLIERALAESGE